MPPPTHKEAVKYVPKRKRQQQRKQQQRFHGAFTGGFSAGYYNTVDTPEGWEPAQASQAQSQQQQASVVAQQNESQPQAQQQAQAQSIHDFMDDQDHNEWGGPRSVQAAYDRVKKPQATNQAPTNTAESVMQQIFSNNEFATAAHAAIQHGGRRGVTEEPVVAVAKIGERLLRQWGWRENNREIGEDDGSTSVITAYIPVSATVTATTTSTEEVGKGGQPTSTIRKITIRPRTTLTMPKQTWRGNLGLGYESLREAPEFQKHHHAQQTRRSNDGKSSVYSISNVLPPRHQDQMEEGRPRRGKNNNGGGGNTDRIFDNDDNDDDNFETWHEFIGTKSSAGFAMNDEDDDVYDDNHGAGGAGDGMGRSIYDTSAAAVAAGGGFAASFGQNQTKGQASGEEEDSEHPPLPKDGGGSAYYETVAYEHHSSSDDEGNETQRQQQQQTNRFRGALSNWVTGGIPDNKEATAATNDNKSSRQHILPGFVLGSLLRNVNNNNNKVIIYKGPDVPIDWDITKNRHVFGEREHPSIYQALSRAEQLQKLDQRKEKTRQQALQAATIRQQQRQQPFTSSVKPQQQQTVTVFSGVGAAMRNRFVSSSTEQQQQQETAAAPTVTGNDTTSAALTDDQPAPSYTTIHRTIQSFDPDPLLCKRMGVPVVRRPQQAQQLHPASVPRTREEAYFQDEILSAATQHQIKNPPPKAPTPSQTLLDELERQDTDNTTTRITRPSMDVYKSIFNPQVLPGKNSDEVEAINDGGSAVGEKVEKTEHSDRAQPLEGNKDHGVGQEVEHNVSLKSCSEQALVPYQENRTKRRHPTASSEENDNDSSSLSSHDRRRKKKHRKEERRKEKKKKRKKGKKRRQKDS